VYWGLGDRHAPEHLGMALIWDYSVSVCCRDVVVLRLRCLFQFLKVHGAHTERCQELGRCPAERKQRVARKEDFTEFFTEFSNLISNKKSSDIAVMLTLAAHAAAHAHAATVLVQ